MKIPIDIVVTDANSYNALVGNDWLSKVSAIIDWNDCEMTLTWEGKEVIVPVEFRKVTPKPLEDERPTKINQKEDEISEEEKLEEDETEEKEGDDEFEDEELENRIYGFSEIKEQDESSEEDNWEDN